MQKHIALLDAPSNLGLRPPAPGIAPGCFKLAGALRDQRLRVRLDAREAGVLTPPRYDGAWKKGEGPRNAAAIATYTKQLADRVAPLLDENFTLVLGGDCSIALGPMLALRRCGRYGIAYLDGHADFRHLGNDDSLQAVGGEDIAVMTGRGDARLVDLEGLGNSARIEDVVYVGIRDDAWCLDEARALGAHALTSGAIANEGASAIATRALNILEQLDGFWIHIDVDVIDGDLLPAVDSPEKDGPNYATVSEILRALGNSSKAMGATVAIYDPDLDPDLLHAPRIADCLVDAFGPKVSLREATPDDLEMMLRWSAAPHLAESGGDGDWAWAEEIHKRPDWREWLIAGLDGHPFGFIQIIDPLLEESHYWGDCESNLRAIDIWIGEPEVIGRGLGTQMMRQAIERCFAPPEVTAILIDPMATNVRAHRFYERFGFKFVERRMFDDDDCFVYRLDRKDWRP